jgi:uncharacterized protein (DUF1697 family)
LKYVAFLRAINVGGHTVKMDHLRGLFEALDLANVETFIASGNVIFDAGKTRPLTLERKIETHLHDSLGYKVTTFIRSIAELAAISSYKPFASSELESDSNVLFVGFLAASPSEEAKSKLLELRNRFWDFHIDGRELYWLRRRLPGEVPFSGMPLEKTLRMQMTLRNVNTVRRLASKYA